MLRLCCLTLQAHRTRVTFIQCITSVSLCRSLRLFIQQRKKLVMLKIFPDSFSVVACKLFVFMSITTWYTEIVRKCKNQTMKKKNQFQSQGIMHSKCLLCRTTHLMLRKQNVLPFDLYVQFLEALLRLWRGWTSVYCC